ncbi:MAG TPA: hypothetical protein VGA63_10015 [Geopsychrobacteraceae bacterium]|jgi:DNA anti-recombination protein RmuC
MDKRKAYEFKLAAQLDEWTAQVALFRAQADQATAEARVDYIEITENLQRRHDETRGKLQELQGASEKTWKEIKVGAEKIWAEVTDAFQSAATRIK